MLLSLREMGWRGDHEGIVDSRRRTAGMPYAAWAKLDDLRIEIA
jgi:hypothetical protein